MLRFFSKFVLWVSVMLALFFVNLLVVANFEARIISDAAISQMESSDVPAAILRTYALLKTASFSICGVAACIFTYLWWIGDINCLFVVSPEK